MLSGWGAEELRVAMTLYTDTFVIRGTLATRHRRLTDVVNLAEEFLVLEDAQLQAHGGRAERHDSPYAQVNLGAVLFAIASDTVVASPELRTPKVAETTLISIPPFSVTGRIHLLPERDVRAALEELNGRFIPVTDATFWSDLLGEAPTSATMIAVNHARAQILSPYGHADPAEGAAEGAASE